MHLYTKLAFALLKVASAQASAATPVNVLSNIYIENPKGTKKRFTDDTGMVQKADGTVVEYPIKEMTYPVDYGALAGYTGQDSVDLDFLKGTGNLHGSFQVWRPDIPGEVETKFMHGLTPEERAEVLVAFGPLLRGSPEHYESESDLLSAMEQFKTPAKQAGLLKKSVHWSDDVSKNLLNGRHYPVSYLTGELDELKESIKNRDWNNFKEELGDSAYAAETILAQRLGLNLPLIGASSTVEKFYARKKKWEEVFDERGVPFNNDYLSGGSNLKKPKKIQAALGLAGHTITKDEARALALKHGGEIEDDWGDVPTI